MIGSTSFCGSTQLIGIGDYLGLFYMQIVPDLHDLRFPCGGAVCLGLLYTGDNENSGTC